MAKKAKEVIIKTNEDGTGIVRTVKSSEEITHVFTEQELLDLGTDLTNKMITYEANETMYKAEAKANKGTLKIAKAEIDSICNKYNSKEETRYVDTEITFNSPRVGLKTCKRIDTGEQLWEREMDIEELEMNQIALPFENTEVEGT